MGLLDKIERGPEGSLADIDGVLESFSRRESPFHCAVFRRDENPESLRDEISCLAASQDALCLGISLGVCAVLLPGALDIALFSHRISRSSNSIEAFSLTTDSAQRAMDALRPYL